jgi:hypothetical protein
MDTFRDYSSVDDVRTVLFPYKTPEAFDHDKKNCTWLLEGCEQHGLDDLWRFGIPALRGSWSIEGVCKEHDEFTDYDDYPSIVYIQLKWAMSFNELSRCFDGWTYTDWNMRDVCIHKPCMRPAKKDFKTEKQYIERTHHEHTMWIAQTPEWYKDSEVQMPTKPKGKQVTKKPPVVAKVPVVAKAVVVTAPQVLTLVVTKQPASNALEVIAPVAKRPCLSDKLEDTTPDGKLLTALKFPMSAESVAEKLSLIGKKEANQRLYRLHLAGKIKLVSGWKSSPGAKGMPMWQVV